MRWTNALEVICRIDCPRGVVAGRVGGIPPARDTVLLFLAPSVRNAIEMPNGGSTVSRRRPFIPSSRRGWLTFGVVHLLLFPSLIPLFTGICNPLLVARFRAAIGMTTGFATVPTRDFLLRIGVKNVSAISR